MKRERLDDIPVNVLMVDDQEANLVALEAMLEDVGANLVKARSGEEALKRLLMDDFAVILMDVMMPGMDGHETARLIRSRPRTRHTPIIFVTAYESLDREVLKAYKEGAVDHLLKPLVPEILRAKVATFVELYEKSERLRRLERSDFEIQLADEQLRLAAIVESSDDAIIGLAVDGTILTWNRGAERIYGYQAAEIIGQSVARLSAAGDEDELPPLLDKIRHGEHLEHYETVHRTNDGRLIDVSLTLSPMRDSSGQISGVSAIARDITDHKRLEEEVRQRAQQLAEADRRKDEFLAMLAHELRNPLAPISNAAQVMRLRGGDDPDLQWVCEVVERQVQHLAHLVDDLLDVSRIAKGKIQLRTKRVELSAIIPHAVEASRPLIEARRHTLEVSLPAEPLWLDGDPTRLAQVVTNLLNNAAKYTEPGGRIGLTVCREASDVVLHVRDTGIGIPPEMLPRIFDMFTQLDQSLDRSQGGLGIGLTLVRSLIELHGGTIRAESAGPGTGSEFVVRLPAGERRGVSSPVSHGESEQRAVPRLPARRVLVVDDNVDAAQSLAMLLKLRGHEVRTLHDGSRVVDEALHFQPHIVILDIRLPLLDGCEVARRLKEREELAEVVLVALTGYGSDEDRRLSYEAGFRFHLVKPVEPDALQAILAQTGEVAAPVT